MILDLVKIKEEPGQAELSVKRNGRVVGTVKMIRIPAPGGWKVSFGGKEIGVAPTTRATTDMVEAFQVDTDGNFSGNCYQVHEGSLFNKYDIYELRYQSLSYNLYPIAPADCKALPVFYGHWQVASIESLDPTSDDMFRDAQILAEDEKAAIVALIFFCYVRSNPKPLTSVTNKNLLGKIDRSFPDRIKI